MERICVFGAGAVGGYLAARLAHAGREVSVVARGAHLAAIERGGLTLITPDETFATRPRAASEPAGLGRQDLVVVAVKAPALPDVARGIGPLLGPETPVAFAMNGVQWWYGQGFRPGGHDVDVSRLDPDGALAEAIGVRALGMIIYSPNEVIEPGVVRNGGGRNRFVLGDPAGGASARLMEVRDGLDGAGFTIETADDIRHEMWLKLVRNISTAPLCALTGARASDIVDDPEVRALARAVLTEALAVASSHGFALDIDPDQSTRPGSRPVHKPSMLQDLERGRPMEIDAMVGSVVDFATQAGVPTPTLATVLALLTLRARTAGLHP